MLKFFRKIRLRLLSENKVSKYFIYAIGEIVLIVIGVLIALQVNNNNENRLQNERSKLFLDKLKIQIDKNIITINGYLKDNQEFLSISKRLLKKIDDKKVTLNHKELDTLIFSNVLEFFINIETTVLDEGKVNGSLVLVESDSLRESIYQFIKEHNIYREREIAINDDLKFNFNPYLIKHYNIRNLIDNAGLLDLGASPKFKVDLKKLFQEPEFENLIIMRIVLQEDMVNSIQGLLDKINLVNHHLNLTNLADSK